MQEQTAEQQIELTIEAEKELEERGQMAERLYNHPDFKKLIVDDFMGTECSRLTLMLASPNLDQSSKDNVMETLQAISIFNQWLSMVVRMGHMAQDAIAEAREELAYIHENGEVFEEPE